MASRTRIRAEDGFTLIELLVVILIIGILAAIALPAFLGQRQKGYDADAKENGRNLVTQLESCYAAQETFVGCMASQEVTQSALIIGTADGQVDATGLGDDDFVVTAYSKAPGHTFTLTKTNGTAAVRSCAPAGEGGCKSDNTW